MNSNDWTFWQNALKGEFGAIHESDPQSGYYRRRNRDGWSAVAIWRDGEHIHCIEGEATTRDAFELWTWVCRTPISYDLYQKVIAGEPWPDLPPAINHNLGMTALETISNELAGEKIEIDAMLKAGRISTKETADRLSNWVGRISDLKKRADAERVAEKKPHDDAASAVQARWKPVVDDAAALERRMKDAIGVYLKEQARLDAQARAQAVAEGAPVKAVENARVGTTGRKVALRTVKAVEITDIKSASAFIAAMNTVPPEFLDAVRLLAGRMLRAGVEVPGAKLSESQIAA